MNKKEPLTMPPAVSPAKSLAMAQETVRDVLCAVKTLVESELPAIHARRFDITYKSDNSPVTAADVYVEMRVKEYLSTRLSPLKFIGEETYAQGDAWQSAGYLAILDPIDGTENFCSGLKEWGVSLGIWFDGVHMGSLLMMPDLGESLISGETMAHYYTSRITGFSSSWDATIGQGMATADEYRAMGCAVYNLYNVICGRFARFINPKGARVWDLLPGIMLALEHHCEVYVNEQIFTGELLNPAEKYRVHIRHQQGIHSG